MSAVDVLDQLIARVASWPVEPRLCVQPPIAQPQKNKQLQNGPQAEQAQPESPEHDVRNEQIQAQISKMTLSSTAEGIDTTYIQDLAPHNGDNSKVDAAARTDCVNVCTTEPKLVEEGAQTEDMTDLSTSVEEGAQTEDMTDLSTSVAAPKPADGVVSVPQPELVGDRIVLSPYLPVHVPIYHHWMQSPDLLEATASERLTLAEEYQAQASWMQDPKKFTFIILDKSRLQEGVEAMVGDVNLYLNQGDHQAEIAVMIAEASGRRKGFALEALQMMMTFGTTRHGITKFVAKILDNNTGSLALFRKLGFGNEQLEEEFNQYVLDFRTPDHVEMVDETPEPIISAEMRIVKQRVAQLNETTSAPTRADWDRLRQECQAEATKPIKSFIESLTRSLSDPDALPSAKASWQSALERKQRQTRATAARVEAALAVVAPASVPKPAWQAPERPVSLPPPSWPADTREMQRRRMIPGVVDAASIISWAEAGKKGTDTQLFPKNPGFNQKLKVWRGDVTNLYVDAIVNAANSALMAGGGICGAIHRGAGPELQRACNKFGGCPTGQTRLTPGFRLPAKYVLHTVGPTSTNPQALASCYRTCLDLCVQHHIRAICFCCISTGIYGYPNHMAAECALLTCRQWMEEYQKQRVDVQQEGAQGAASRMAGSGEEESEAGTNDYGNDGMPDIIFCTFLPKDQEIYARLLPRYFPL